MTTTHKFPPQRNGLMFITDANKILRAHMDGSLVKILVEDAVYKVR